VPCDEAACICVGMLHPTSQPGHITARAAAGTRVLDTFCLRLSFPDSDHRLQTFSVFMKQLVTFLLQS